MLYEMAVADAYAIAFEFVDDYKEHKLVNDLASFQQHPKYDGLKPSQYTDDTQRSIANAHVVISGGFTDPCNFVDQMLNVFREDPRDGYSRRFQSYMEEKQNVGALAFLKGIETRKETNGSVMGVLPCGYLSNPIYVRLAAGIQAMTTHSAATIPYAQMMALAAHFFVIENGSPDGLLSYLDQECEGDPLIDFELIEPQRCPMTAKDTAHNVMRYLLKHRSMNAMLHDVVEIGGDTDSVAALAIGIASCSRAYENDLAKSLWTGVEFGDRRKQMALLELDACLDECRY